MLSLATLALLTVQGAQVPTTRAPSVPLVAHDPYFSVWSPADNLADTGACGSAAVPLFLDHAWRSGMIEVGQRVSLIGVEATKWIWAGITLDWTAPAPASTGRDA